MAKNENLVYGVHPVLETIRSGKHLEKLFIQKGFKNENAEELKALTRELQIPFSVVPVEKLNRLTIKNHQGVVALVSLVQYFPLDQVITQVYEKGDNPLMLMLDGVTDVRNFGSIARTAECMGVHGIVIPTQGSAQINADAVRTSAGALNYIPVIREPNLGISITEMKQSGLKIVACTEKTKDHLSDIDFKDPACLVMGSEDHGISSEILAACDQRGKVPMHGQVESLNVGAACGMALYEINRQRSE